MPMMRASAGALAVLLILASTATAQQASPGTAAPPPPAGVAVPPPNDYGRPESWLCRPGRQDACATDLTTTVVEADGSLRREPFAADPKAPVDCFYVYPTVSTDPTPNSDMLPGLEEREVAAQQFARFGAACRLFSPLYRQVTVNALAETLSGRAVPANRVLPYNDVRDAWRYYLEHDNQGRGVVLIGHSQGSQILTQLLRSEIEGRPVQHQIVSAILPGWNVIVPVGQETGGAFQQIPLCRRAAQVGCVVTYVSFRASAPPPADAVLGRVVTPGRMAGCTNPASLGGGHGDLRSYFRTTPRVPGATVTPRAWLAPPSSIDTPFVTLPGLLSAECRSDSRGSYLAVTVHGNPEDPRTDDIPGDLRVDGVPQPRWGLHLVDLNLALGNLVELVRQQARAYLAAGRNPEER